MSKSVYYTVLNLTVYIMTNKKMFIYPVELTLLFITFQRSW